MQVVLEVTAGSNAGRKVRLGAGQVLEVGRTQWADLAVPEDADMADIHFSLEANHAGCHIQDLGGVGTRVNGQQVVHRAVLRDGDKIDAGKTTFTVHLEGDAVEPTPTVVPDADRKEVVDARRSGLMTTPVRVAAADSPTESRIGYTVETCDTGVTLYRGQIDEIPPHELAVALGQLLPPCLIVDFKKLDSGRPETLECADYLFDWLVPAAAAVASPVILSPRDWAAWPTFIEEGWGEDAVVCLFSRLEKPALLSHLRAACHDGSDPKGRGTAAMGFCWPSVMAPLLAHYTPEFVTKLLRDIDAVLVELPDLPITWQIYADEQFGLLLDQLGFAREEETAEEAPPGTGLEP